MKTLSKFMAEYIANQTVLNSNVLERWFHNAIEAYKEHLQEEINNGPAFREINHPGLAIKSLKFMENKK